VEDQEGAHGAATVSAVAGLDGDSRRTFLRGLAGRAVAGEPPRAGAAAAGPVERDAPPAPPPDALGSEERERYARQLALPEWSEDAQLALRSASVIVVGAGGLGSPVAAYLAGAGVGRIGIVDDGAVERSNLHRQLLHFTPDVGVPKAHSAVAKLGFLNPGVVAEPYQARLEPANAAALLAGADLVLDCSDSFATRYAVNVACCRAGTALVEAGVSGFSGFVLAIRPGRTACYRCAFPTPPSPAARREGAGGEVPSRGDPAAGGVLGPAAGVIGSLQALAALELLGGLERAADLLQLDLRAPSLTRVRVPRRADCPDCGSRADES
jgi:adenylyltransferase/sulfurtransferase